MTVALLLAAVAVAAALLFDRRDKRHQAERALLLRLMHDERERMAQRVHDERVAIENARAQASPDLEALIALVENLCQRVQAPKEAIVQHQMESGPLLAPSAVLPDDDLGWFAAREQIPKEDLAEQLMEQELAERGAD